MYCQHINHRDRGSQIFGVPNMQPFNRKDPESLAYESISSKEARLSTIRDNVNPAVEDNVTIQVNPSYLAFCSNHQENPTAEDKVNPSYLDIVDNSSPQEKQAAETKTNAEEKYAYITVK